MLREVLSSHMYLSNLSILLSDCCSSSACCTSFESVYSTQVKAPTQEPMIDFCFSLQSSVALRSVSYVWLQAIFECIAPSARYFVNQLRQQANKTNTLRSPQTSSCWNGVCIKWKSW